MENKLNILREAKVEILSHFVKPEELKGFNLNNYDIYTIYDLYNFSDFGRITPAKAKKVKSLHDMLVYNDDNIIEQIVDYCAVPVLPRNASEDMSLAELISSFITEYVARVKEMGQRLTIMQLSRAEVVDLYYGKGYERDEVALLIERDRELVRRYTTAITIPEAFINLIHNMVDGNVPDKDQPVCSMSEILIEKLREIREFQHPCRLVDFKQKCGIADNMSPGLLEFFLDFTRTAIYQGSFEEQFVVGVNITTIDQEVVSFIFHKLRDVIKPYSKVKLIKDIKKRFPNLSDEMLKLYLGIIDSSSQVSKTYETYDVLYQLTWKDLKYVQYRIERIVYDFQDDTIHRSAIVDEYNRLATVYGGETIDPRTLSIKSTRDSIATKGKDITNITEKVSGGFWGWCGDGNKASTFSVQDLVKQYAAEHKVVTIDAVVTYVTQFIANPNKKSIKSYINTCCYATTDGVYVYESCAKEFTNYIYIKHEDILPDLTSMLRKNSGYYTLGEMYDLYFTTYGIHISKDKIYKTINNNREYFNIEKINNKTLKISYRKNATVENDSKQEKIYKSEYKKDIRSNAISILRHSKDFCCPLSELKKTVMKYLPPHIQHTNIYKIFSDDPIFIKQGEGRNQIISLNKDLWVKLYEEEIDTNQRQEAESTQYITNNDTANKYSNALFIFDPQLHLTSLRDSIKSSIQFNLYQIRKDGMDITDLDKAWDNMIKIMNLDSENIDGGYRRLLALCYSCKFGSTTHWDRYLLYLELRFAYEPFIKSVRRILYPEQLPLNKLGENIKDLQDRGVLPKQEEICYINTYLEKIRKRRNYKGHNLENTPNDEEIARYTNTFITLFLYTASRVTL